MSNSFFLIVSGKYCCSLKRMGESDVREFSEVSEALSYVCRRLHGGPGEVTITNQFTGATQIIKIDPEKPMPIVTELAA